MPNSKEQPSRASPGPRNTLTMTLIVVGLALVVVSSLVLVGMSGLLGRGASTDASEPTAADGTPSASGDAPSAYVSSPPSSPTPARSAARNPPRTAGSRPGAANTGVPRTITLKRYSGWYLVTKDGSVVDGLNITNALEIRANNVTVKNTRVQCIGVNDGCIQIRAGFKGTVIQDSDVGGGVDGTTFTGSPIGVLITRSSSINNAANTRLIRLNIHHTTDGLRADGNVTITSSYIHHLDNNPAAHGDGSQTTGGSNIVFRNNTIIGGQTSAIYLNQDSPAPIGNVTIDANWLDGPPSGTAYTLYVNDGVVSNSVTVTGNRFGRTGNPYAPARDYRDGIGTWSNNTYDDNGQQIAKP